jgi:hypothetical protein
MWEPERGRAATQMMIIIINHSLRRDPAALLVLKVLGSCCYGVLSYLQQTQQPSHMHPYSWYDTKPCHFCNTSSVLTHRPAVAG